MASDILVGCANIGKFEAEETQDGSDGKGTGISHEYFLLFFCFPKYIVIEEWHDSSQGGERQECVGVFFMEKEESSIVCQRHRTESGR